MTSAEVSHRLLFVWRDIDAVLAPVLGRRGVDALFSRSLHLTQRIHSWLVHSGSEDASPDLPALGAALERQNAPEAIAAAIHILDTFHSLLASLVGHSLTERLLRSVWTHASSPPHGQDSSQ